MNGMLEVLGNGIIFCFEVDKERKLRIGLIILYVEIRYKYMISILYFIVIVEFKGIIDYFRDCVVCISCKLLLS